MLARPILFEKIKDVFNGLFINTKENTFDESSYNDLSQFKPYNPDDLYQKEGNHSIYSEMMKDDQVSICMQLKKNLVLSSGWDIITESEDDAEIADDVERALKEDCEVSFEDLIEEVLSAYEYGFSCTEKIFKKRNDNTIGLKILKTRHPDSWLFYTDVHGNMEKIVQRGTMADIDVDPKVLIHYIVNRKFQNPYGTSDLRPAYAAWFAKNQIIRYYGMFLEKHAGPIPVGKYDKNAPQQAVTDIFNALKKFQTKTTLVIPKDLEVEFLESKSNGEAFIRGINIFNMFIGRSLVIPDLLGFQGSETSGGSYSLGKEQMEVFFKHIQRRRNSIERLINNEIIKPIVLFNHGFVDNFPKFKLRPIRDDDALEASRVWLDAVKSKVWTPSDEEINHFRKIVNYPEGEVEIPEPSLPSIPSAPNSALNTGGALSPSPESSDDQLPEDEIPADQTDSENDEIIDETEMECEEKKQFGLYDVPKGNYYKKVDFKAIESQMNAAEASIKDAAKPVIEKIFRDMFDQMQRRNIVKGQKIDKLDSIKLKYLNELKAILKYQFRSTFQDGQKSAQKEIFKSENFATPIASDEFLEVLDQELFQFIGDWEYKVTQKAQIAMRNAIKDGQPLSSVIDILTEEGIAESEVSVERFSRTKTTEVMNRGRLAFFDKANVVDKYQYSAILDSVTSPICRGLNGKIFTKNNAPLPPLHWNCRSLLVPITVFEEATVDTKVGNTDINTFINENKGAGFSKQ